MLLSHMTPAFHAVDSPRPHSLTTGRFTLRGQQFSETENVWPIIILAIAVKNSNMPFDGTSVSYLLPYILSFEALKIFDSQQ